MQAAGTETRSPKGLIALVVIMSVLIVAGLIVVVVTIAIRLGDGSVGFEAADLQIPGGCQVVETVPADDRLVLRLGTAERCNQVLIVDMATGKLLATIRLVAEPQ